MIFLQIMIFWILENKCINLTNIKKSLIKISHQHVSFKSVRRFMKNMKLKYAKNWNLAGRLMGRSRKKNPSSLITLLMKSLTLALEFLLMTRKSLVTKVCNHSFNKVSLLRLESAKRPLKNFEMQLLP